MTYSFGDEILKLASRADILKALARKAGKEATKTPTRRAASLGAGVTGVQEVVGSEDPDVLRSLAAGAAGGALTGKLFPGWFTRGNTAAGLRAKKGK